MKNQHEIKRRFKIELQKAGYSDIESENLIEKGFGKDMLQKFPNGRWVTVSGARVFIDQGGKVVAGLDGFNGHIDEAFKKENESKKDSKPEIVKRVESGNWNGKFYGGGRNGHSIYISGNEVNISNEEKSQLEKYKKDKKEQDKKQQEQAEKKKQQEREKIEKQGNTIEFGKDLINKIKEKKEKVGQVLKNVGIPEDMRGWNGKVYGQKGNHSIYLNGDKKEISDKDADALDLDSYGINRQNPYKTIIKLDSLKSGEELEFVDSLHLVDIYLEKIGEGSAYALPSVSELEKHLPNLSITQSEVKELKDGTKIRFNTVLHNGEEFYSKIEQLHPDGYYTVTPINSKEEIKEYKEKVKSMM